MSTHDPAGGVLPELGVLPEPVFDTIAAAPLLGVKPGTLEIWRCKGIGPRFIKSGARVIYRLRDINAYLDSRTRSSTADPGASRPE